MEVRFETEVKQGGETHIRLGSSLCPKVPPLMPCSVLEAKYIIKKSLVLLN